MFPLTANHVLSFHPRSRAAKIPAASSLFRSNILHILLKSSDTSIPLVELPPAPGDGDKTQNDKQHCCLQQELGRKLHLPYSAPEEM
ncbi:MAG: hypothetical protein LQ341_007705, partial [Variospora aurantia]